MKKSLFLALAFVAGAGPATATRAQTAPVDAAASAPTPAAAPAAAAVPAATCELRLWPAERMMSHTMGLLGGMGVVGAVVDTAAHANRDTTNRAQMASALDSPSQLDALQSLNLATELGLPADTAIIRHEAPLERHTMNSIKTRRGE